MAGLSGPQAVVDVVAASELLRPSEKRKRHRAARTEAVPLTVEAADTAATEPELASGLAYLPGEEPARCALGHENHPDFRFCATCGVSMAATAPPGGAPMQRPVPAGQLSDAERAERDRKHAEAMAAAARFEQSQQEYVPTAGEAIVVHFVADGLTFAGQVWMRGQEIEIGPAHPRWTEARGWITLDRFAQVDRWGEQKFDFGPWPGRRSYTDALGSFEQLAGTAPDGSKVTIGGPSEAELRAADDAERRRGRAVPAPAFR